MTELNHIACILDGNRRFSKRLMLEPWKGHEFGAKKVKDFLGWCREVGAKVVTLYSFSIQNFKRPKEEFEYLMKLFEKEFNNVATDIETHKNKVKINVIGRIHLLPDYVQKSIKNAMEATKNYKDFIINFAIAYGGQEEITDAVIKIAKEAAKGLVKPELITEETVRHSLYTNGQPYPDIVIRTGGETRLSNFLSWQSAYSELFFIDKLWPEMTKEDFTKVIDEYKSRERRFGK